MHSAEDRPKLLVNAKRALHFSKDVFEATCLEPTRSGLRVAMHRVAHPQHRLTSGTNRVDQRRQAPFDLLDSEAVDQGQATRLVLRIEDFKQRLQPLRVHPRADLYADGIRDAPEEFHMGAAD